MITRTDFLDALTAARAGLEAKDSVEQSSSFVFQGGRVYTYDDEVSASHPLALKFEGALNGKKLMELLTKFDKEELKIKAGDGKFIIKSGKAKATLSYEEDITMPLDQLSDPDQWKKIPKGMVKSISFVLLSIGNDPAKPLTSCVHVTENYAESSDNIRITRHFMGKTIQGDLLIPGVAAKELKDLNPTHYAQSGGWIHFKNAEDTHLSARMMEGEFPNLSSCFGIKGDSVELPKGLEEVLDRASVLSDDIVDGVTSITIEGQGKTALVTSKGPDGKYEEEIELTEELNFSFMIPAKLLVAILKHNRTGIFGQNMVLFESEEFKHAVLLLASV